MLYKTLIFIILEISRIIDVILLDSGWFTDKHSDSHAVTLLLMSYSVAVVLLVHFTNLSGRCFFEHIGAANKI